MRERLWLTLRDSHLLRRLYGMVFLTGPIRAASFLLLPSYSKRLLRVRSGPGEGLLLELNPRWEKPIWEGTCELPVQRILEELLWPGMTFYDVGGGIGFYSLLAARLGARVFAFEPDLQNAESIRLNAERNALENQVQIIPKAVFSYSGEIGLEPADCRQGHGCAHVRIDGKMDEGARFVDCTTLDDFIRENPAPDLVKIDVEGAESEVLKGADNLFRTVRPQLVCEVHDASNAEFACAWLRARGYGLRWLDNERSSTRHVLGLPVESARTANTV